MIRSFDEARVLSAFGKALRRLANAGVNVDLTYLATGTRLVIGPDDLDKARAAL